MGNSSFVPGQDFGTKDVSGIRDLRLQRDLYAPRNVRVGHDLRVEGWLKADNVKCANKGLFPSLAALQGAYPGPEEGWFAGVLATASDLSELGVAATPGVSYFRMYLFDGGVWTAQPGLYEISADVDAFAEEVESLASTLDSRINSIDLSQIAFSHSWLQNFCQKASASFWQVTVSSGSLTTPVGVLLMTSDNLKHVVTQAFFTHYTAVGGVISSSSAHDCGKLSAYVRTYGVASPFSGMEGFDVVNGSWSGWRPLFPTVGLSGKVDFSVLPVGTGAEEVYSGSAGAQDAFWIANLKQGLKVVVYEGGDGVDRLKACTEPGYYCLVDSTDAAYKTDLLVVSAKAESAGSGTEWEFVQYLFSGEGSKRRKCRKLAGNDTPVWTAWLNDSEAIEYSKGHLPQVESDLTATMATVGEQGTAVAALQSGVAALESDSAQLKSDVAQLLSDDAQLVSDVLALKRGFRYVEISEPGTDWDVLDSYTEPGWYFLVDAASESNVRILAVSHRKSLRLSGWKVTQFLFSSSGMQRRTGSMSTISGMGFSWSAWVDDSSTLSQYGNRISVLENKAASLRTDVDGKVSASDVVQELGNSESAVMSQAAVSAQIHQVQEAFDAMGGLVNGKVSASDVVQSTGDSESQVMSQKAVTEALAEKASITDVGLQAQSLQSSISANTVAINGKLSASDVVQEAGSSTVKVMSQKAVTDSIELVASGLAENMARTDSNNNFSTAQTVNGTLTVNGDIVQNGSSYVTEAEHVKTRNSYVTVRDGAVGGLGTDERAGIEVVNYDGENDGVIEVGPDGVARVGDKGDAQPLLTRVEASSLKDGDLLVWDAANQRAVPLECDIVDMEVTYDDESTETFKVLCKHVTNSEE